MKNLMNFNDFLNESWPPSGSDIIKQSIKADMEERGFEYKDEGDEVIMLPNDDYYWEPYDEEDEFELYAKEYADSLRKYTDKIGDVIGEENLDDLNHYINVIGKLTDVEDFEIAKTDLRDFLSDYDVTLINKIFQD